MSEERQASVTRKWTFPQPQSVALPHLDASAAFFAPGLALQASLSAALPHLDASPTFFAPGLALQASLSAALPHLAAAPTLFAPLMTVDPAGTINAVEIEANGQFAVARISEWGPHAGSITYDDGLSAANLPTANTATVSVTSRSWTEGLAETTIARTLYARETVRNAGLTTLDETVDGDDLLVRFPLSHFVYADDTPGAFSFPAGWANNGVDDSGPSNGVCTSLSTRAYMQPAAAWINPPLDRVTSPTYAAAISVGHGHFQLAQGVRAVRFTATDESANSVSAIATAETKKTYAGSGLSCCAYSADLDFSTLTPGEMVTTKYEVFPWVGDVYDVSVDGAAYPSANPTVRKFLNDRDGSYGTVYAYVDGVGGSGAVHETPATAQTTPFDTVPNAAAALQTYINANFGRNNVSGGVIRLESGTHVHGSFSARAVGEIPLVIEAADSADKLTTFYTDPGSSVSNGLCDKVRFNDLTLQKSNSSSVIFLDSAAALGDGNELVLSNCHFDLNAQTPYDAWVYKVGRIFAENCTGDDCRQFRAFSTAAKNVTARGCSGTGALTLAIVHSMLACKDLECIFAPSAGNAGNDAVVSSLVGWSHLASSVNSQQIYKIENPVGASGAVVVGSVFEQAGGLSGPAVYISADNDSADAIENVCVYGSTVVGSRVNWLYDSAGATHPAKSGVFTGNVAASFNIKGDLFPTADAARIGNFGQLHHVGAAHNCFLTGSDDSNPDQTPGNNKWVGQIYCLGGQVGSPSTPIDPDWTDDASFSGSGLADGDYRPGVSTEIGLWPAGESPFAFDYNGAALADDGTDTKGALQPA